MLDRKHPWSQGPHKVARTSSSESIEAQSLKRTQTWESIKGLAVEALRREEDHRVSLAAGRSSVAPSVDALLASLATATVEGQSVTRVLAPALRELFSRPTGARPAPRPRTRRARILMLLANQGPLHASQIAQALSAELTRVLYCLTDMMRDANELQHAGGGLWELTAEGWRAARALAAPEELFGSARGPRP